MTKDIVPYNKNHIDSIKTLSWDLLSKETKKSYQSDYNMFFEYINKPIEEITSSDIKRYIDYLEHEKKYKLSTINRKISSLSKLFEVMKMAVEIDINPVELLKKLKKIQYKTSKEVHVPLTLDDIKKVVLGKHNDPDHIVKMRMMIEFLMTSGLRVSEIISIKHNDIIDFNNKTKKIRIIGKGKKERFIYIESKMIDRIYKIFPEENQYLFYSKKNTKYCRQHMWRLIRKIFEEKTGKTVWPHMIRHFFVTYKISIEKQDIKAVSRYVGHSDVSTTIGMYVDTSLDEKNAGIKIK